MLEGQEWARIRDSIRLNRHHGHDELSHPKSHTFLKFLNQNSLGLLDGGKHKGLAIVVSVSYAK